MIPARRLLALLLLALAAVLAGGCGSDDDKAPSDAAGILKDTFGPDKPVKSGRLDVAVSFDATGLQGVDGPVRLSLKGPFQSKGGTTLPAFDFDLGLTAGGTTFTAGAISTEEKGYLKLQGSSYVLTDAIYKQFKDGYEASAKEAGKEDSGPSFRTLGVDPVRWLSAPKKVGTEDVGGAETNHVSATVDVPKLLADVDTLLKKAGNLGGAAGQAAAGVPNGLTAAQREQIQEAVTSATFDVWAGKDDGILRKLAVKVAFDVPAAGRAAAGGLQKGTIGLTLAIADLNKDQTIDAPKSSRPLSELQAAAAQLLGGVSGGTTPAPQGSGTGAGSGAGSGGSTAPATPQSPYTECLATAGTDIAKVNDCAKLLNK